MFSFHWQSHETLTSGVVYLQQFCIIRNGQWANNLGKSKHTAGLDCSHKIHNKVMCHPYVCFHKGTPNDQSTCTSSEQEQEQEQE